MAVIAAISRARRPPSGGASPQVPYLATITVAGDASVVMTHATNAYIVTAQTDQFGQPFVGAPGPFVFLSSDPTKGTINSGGVVTPVAPGGTDITVEVVNSRGETITSNAVSLTVHAQVATGAIVIDPPSATIPNPGTRQFTATVYDQADAPNVIVGASVSWEIADESKATVDAAGLVTSVDATAGTPTTLTATSGGASGTANVAVSNASSVTQVVVSYLGDVSGQNLFWTGQSYPLVAKDQAGNTLTGAVGEWTSSDPTNAPIGASTGIVSPTGIATAATFLYTHTDTGLTGALTASTLAAPGAWLNSDQASNYPTDAAFRNAISQSGSQGINTPASTGPGNAKYNIAVSPGRITLDATRPFMGAATFLCTYGTDGNVPQLFGFIRNVDTNLYTSLHVLRLVRWELGFNSGVSVPGNNGSYKDGFFVSNSGQSGRTGPDFSNGNGTGANIFVQCNLQNGGTTIGGQSETSVGNVTTEWQDGAWYGEYYIYDTPCNNIMRCRIYRWKMGTHPRTATLLSTTPVQGPMNVGLSVMRMNYMAPFGLNRNIPPTTPLYKSIAFWGLVDGSVYGDPFGFQGAQATPTLSGISGGTVLQGATNHTITLTGTNFNLNCVPVLSNSNILVQSFQLTGSTSMAVVVNVPLNATSGAGTIAVRNTASNVTTSTQVLTVSALGPPSAPSANNASAVSFTTLTFPVTLNASGNLPDTLKWRYRVTGSGSGFTDGSDITLTSPSLGQALDQQVTLPAPSTGYDVQFAAANSSGASSYTATVTGTTDATPALITSGLIFDGDADVGLDVSTDGAGVGSLMDQSATGVQLFQGTGSRKPILRTNVAAYNGHNCLEFTSANQSNLTAAQVYAALNANTTVTVYVVGRSRVATTTTTGRILYNLAAANAQGWHLTMLQGGSTVRFQWGTGVASTFGAIVLSTGMTLASGVHILTGVINASTLQTGYYDGVAQPTTALAYARNTANPPFLSLGSSNGSGNFWDGDAARYLIYAGAHDASQVAQMCAYLANRYGTV